LPSASIAFKPHSICRSAGSITNGAGLRSFLPDGDPVAGYAPDALGFFWLAGQGGYGIQSAPAMARSAAALVQGLDLPGDVADLGVTAAALSPSRQQVAA
jgi:D-arginine dehydrogenase